MKKLISLPGFPGSLDPEFAKLALASGGAEKLQSDHICEGLSSYILSHLDDKIMETILFLPTVETATEARSHSTKTTKDRMLEVIIKNSLMDAQNKFFFGCGFCYISKEEVKNLFPEKNDDFLRLELIETFNTFAKKVDYFLQLRVFDIDPAGASDTIECTYYYNFNKKFPW